MKQPWGERGEERGEDNISKSPLLPLLS